MAAITLVPRTIVTLTSTGASTANGVANSAGTDLDLRASGNFAGDWQLQFEFICQWATVTGLSANVLVGYLYLVPKMDGTNAPTMNASGGTLPPPTLAAPFFLARTPTANTDERMVSAVVDAAPRLYTAYLLNKSGQTISANWTLKAIGDQGSVV